MLLLFFCCKPKQKKSELLVLSLHLEFDNNLGVDFGCRGDVQRLQGRCARVAREMCKGCRGDVQRLPGRYVKEQK